MVIVICKKCRTRYEMEHPLPKKFKCGECGHEKFAYGGGQVLNHGPIRKPKRPRPASTFTPFGHNHELDLGLSLLIEAQK
jgi:PHP family Zn ribbon phosphoesterase